MPKNGVEDRWTEGLWSQVIRLKLYIVGISLSGAGLASYFYSEYGNLPEGPGNALQALGLALFPVGLLTVLLEYFLRRESLGHIREAISSHVVQQVDTAVRAGILEAADHGTILDSKPSDDQISRLIRASESEILILGLSLRNFIDSESIRGGLLERLRSSSVRIRIVMIDPESRFVQWREKMYWQERGNLTYFYKTEIDMHKTSLQGLLEHARGVGHLEVYTYDLMPSVYMMAFDDTFLFANYLTNRSVSGGPFIQLDARRHPSATAALRENFTNILQHEKTQRVRRPETKGSQRFVVVVAAQDGGLYFVKNSNRKWELPAGYIEQGESEAEAAVREFGEEVGRGFSIKDIVNRDRYALVYGIAGETSGQPRAGEIEEAQVFKERPAEEDLSFYEPEDLLIIDQGFVFARNVEGGR